MSKHIAAALPIAARMFADRLRVPVKIGGSQPATDNETLYLPELPLESKKAEILAFGSLTHESGHLYDTDFDALPPEGLVFDIWNILEDVWTEMSQRRRFLGAKRTLSDLVELLYSDGEIGQVPLGAPPIDVMMAYMLYRLRCDVLGQTVLANSANETEALLREMIPATTFDQLTKIMFEVVDCRSTAGAVLLAERILSLLKNDSEKEPPQTQGDQPANDQGNQPGSQQGQGESKEATGDGGKEDKNGDKPVESPSNGDPDQSQGDKAVQGQDGNAGDGTGEQSDKPQSGAGKSDGEPNDEKGDKPAGSQSGAGQPDDSKEANGRSDPTQGDSPSDGEGRKPGEEPMVTGQPCSRRPDQEGETTKEQTENLKTIVAADRPNITTDLGKVIAKSLNSVGRKNDDGTMTAPKMAESEMSDGMIDPTDLLEATRASTTALRYKMDQLMEAQRRCQRLYAKSGRKVVANRVWKLRTGNTKVFEKQTDGLEVDTAVMLLLDRSQSMQRQLGLACQATLSLLLSLARVDGVSAAAAAFPAPVGLSDRFDQHGKGVTVLTDFGERVVATASRYASLGDYGLTPMAEALLWSVYKLLSQKADRRILFVTTDGEPDNKEAALKVIKMAERCGIEIIGLGIAQEIAHLIPESRKIDHIDQMPKAVFEMLESKLALPLAA